MPESRINEFGRWISLVDWTYLNEIESLDDMAKTFETKLLGKIDEIFPTKKLKLSNNSKPWFT